MTSFRVRDDSRVITFEGVRLASVTSAEDGKERWIELRLYLTEAGTYVLEGVGRTTVEGEQNRCWVQLSDEPAGIIDRLYMQSDDGARYIPRTSRRLLELASESDDAMRNAFMREHID